MKTHSWKNAVGFEFQGQSWPRANSTTTVAIIHGHGEHIGRYDYVAKKLNEAGYSVMGLDLRGHGKSQGSRGHIPDFETILSDIDLFLTEVNKSFPDQSIILYGHSMGGNLSLNYLLRNKPALKGALISSPWLKNAFSPPVVKEFLGKVMNNIWPSLSLPTGLDTKQLTRDPQVVKEYIDDPLVHSMISSRLYNSFMESGEWALNNSSVDSIPMFLIHGKKDGITSWEATRKVSEQLTGSISTFWHEDGFHELHNEPDKDETIQKIISWMNSLK